MKLRISFFLTLFCYSCFTSNRIGVDNKIDSQCFLCDSVLKQKLIVYFDTLRYTSDNTFAVGLIGKCDLSDNVSFKIGSWTHYYETGNVKWKGQYGFEIVKRCGVMGYEYNQHSYKLGRWIYYNKDKTVRADLMYNTVLSGTVSSTCGDTFFHKKSFIDPVSKFYDTLNRLILPDSSLLTQYLIENDGIVVK